MFQPSFAVRSVCGLTAVSALTARRCPRRLVGSPALHCTAVECRRPSPLPHPPPSLPVDVTVLPVSHPPALPPPPPQVLLPFLFYPARHYGAFVALPGAARSACRDVPRAVRAARLARAPRRHCVCRGQVAARRALVLCFFSMHFVASSCLFSTTLLGLRSVADARSH